MRTFSSLLLLCFLGSVTAYKYAVFVPNVANSQVQFAARVAEVLSVDGGHDVTMIFLSHFSDYKTDVKTPKGVKSYHVHAIVDGITKERIEKEQGAMLFKKYELQDLFKMRALYGRLGRMFQDGCRLALRDKKFLNWLEAERFDMSFAFVYMSTCSVGLTHLAKIPTWAWLNSGPMMDYVAQMAGVPTVPSYVPPIMMESIDEMGFYNRLKSFVGHSISGTIHRRFVSDVETQIFREELEDPDFPHTMDIGARCPLLFVNTNELYDLPRPTISKVINIGGLGVGFESAKPLPADLQEIAVTGKGLVVFSFGSIAAAHEMPLEWKNSLLDAFASFPDFQFVMRYQGDDLNGTLPANVHLFRWLPQKDLLLHRNTKAFITHGGYNSMQEAISAGVPLVTIALFGDQLKNSLIAGKHGFAVNIQKEFVSKKRIEEALGEVLRDEKYKNNVLRFSAMVRAQPMKPAERLLKWSEFLAEFKQLENLEPAGVKLNFVQYHSIDVIVFLLTILLLTLLISIKGLKAFITMCRTEEKVKTK